MKPGGVANHDNPVDDRLLIDQDRIVSNGSLIRSNRADQPGEFPFGNGILNRDILPKREDLDPGGQAASPKDARKRMSKTN
jgi:hypothetical protein